MSDKIYGIDLGTTNSLIGHGDELYSGLVASVVNLKDSTAGSKYKREYGSNIIRSFKINMSMGSEGQAPINASSIVLRELVSQVKDAKVENVVISVPAYFTDNERQATIKAAKLAGLNVAAIINEPTAAAIYYNKDVRGLSLVYDLGGGTFDVSLIDNRCGTYDVIATSGLTIGGDNLDIAIKQHVMKAAGILSHRLSNDEDSKLKCLCEDAKISIQKDRKDYTIDLSDFKDSKGSDSYTLTVDTYKQIMELTFKKTIRMTQQLIGESIVDGDPFDVIMVGGSTRCPYLREWVAEELDQEPVPVTYDPDRIVAQGACHYGIMLETGEASSKVQDVLSQSIGIVLDTGEVDRLIPAGTKLPAKETKMLYNPVESHYLDLEVCQGDNILASLNTSIGKISYDYGKFKEARKGSVKVTLEVSADGVITIRAKEPFKPEVAMSFDRNKVDISTTEEK